MQPKIQILSNTNYALADVLKSELIESTSVKIAVAFLRRTGLDYIYKGLDYALTTNNANIEFIVGLDFKTTDAEALTALNELKTKYQNFQFYCFGDKRDNHNDLVFHPKIYMFHTELSKGTKYSSIVGSSNFTGGGLTTNFEVNTIFREHKPIYFNQLNAIYDEIKYTDSIFQPSNNYIKKYGNIKEELDKSTKKILDFDVKNEIQELKKEELSLPSSIPSLKKLIINFIKEKNASGIIAVPLNEIYEAMEKIIQDKNLSDKYTLSTFRNNIRGEINTHEVESTHKSNLKLFKREGLALYCLAENGVSYQGR
ncbi:MAG: restriction endonuclease [Bacteroidetes bacterium]|nr:MAG: restriction endonuclease [Bacteroidota bacterium]TAG87947.1 MAG: restriction endonuclease [Bacteroidota bacterium]